MTRTDANPLGLRIAQVITLASMLAFAIVSIPFGGGVPSTPLFSAIAEAGPYFLDNRGHFTEVSRHIYVALVWLSRVFFAGGFLVIFWGASRHLRRKNRISN
jgi:hypothetical protein